MRNSTKIRKIENLSIQLLILVLSYLFIYNQVFRKGDLPALLTELWKDVTNPVFQGQLAVVVLLMFFNWSVEAIKWRFLIRKIEKVGFFKALQGVLTGITISSFTPNRVGEFFGRAFILRQASHVEGILITVIGSMSQLLVTILTGNLALLLFFPMCLPDMFFSNGYLYYTVVAIVLMLEFILLGLFFNVSNLTLLKERILRNRLERFQKFFRVFAFYRNRDLAAVILLSLFRYFVFSLQFFLLLRMLDVPISYFHAMVLISLTFLIMAVIPTIALTELGIRGSVALYVFGLYFTTRIADPEQFKGAIFTATTLLWVINLGIPALAGSLFVFRLEFFRRGE